MSVKAFIIFTALLRIEDTAAVQVNWSVIDKVRSFMVDRSSDSDVSYKEGVRFFLWTRLNPSEAFELFPDRPDILKYSPFRQHRPVKVVIHGFKGNGTTYNFISQLRAAYLLLGDINVISVDWSSLAEGPNYVRAAKNTTPVGGYVAKFLDFLIQPATAEILARDIHLIGYSLGAHVAGSAGHSLTLGRIQRITGLDPPSLGFGKLNGLRGLDVNDADLVDVIHSSALPFGVGTVDPIGHVDFYPNGGRLQNGCLEDTEHQSLITCSHSLSKDYFIESINGLDKFLSTKCSSYDRFKNGLCGTCKPLNWCCKDASADCVSMGEHVSRGARGVYFLNTNPTSPYSLE